MKPHLWKTCVVFAFLCSVAGTLPAQDDTPLKAIPDDFHVIVRFRTPQPTVTRVSKQLNEISPGSGALLEMGFAQIGMFVGLQSLEGVDTSADWWMALKLKPDDMPTQVFILPGKSKNPKLMHKSFEEGLSYVQFRQWNVVSQDEEIINAIAKRIKGEGSSISTLLDKEHLGVLERGDLSAWVNLQGMRKLYAAQIDAFKAQLETGIQIAAGAAAGPNQAQAQQGVDIMSKTVLPAVVQFLEDMKSGSGSVLLGRSGGVVEKYVTVKAGSPTAKILAGQTTSEMKGLTHLPSSHLIFVGLSGNTNSFMNWGMGMAQSVVSDEPTKKLLTDLTAEMTKLKLGAITMSFNSGKEEEGMMQSVSLLEVDNVQRMRELSRKASGQMKTFQQGGMKGTIDFKPDAEKYGLFSADVQTTQMEIEKSAPMAEAQKQMWEKMYGTNGMSVRTFYLKNYVMQVIGGKDLAAAAVLAYEGKVPSVKKPVAKPGTPVTAKKNGRNTSEGSRDGEVRKAKGAAEAPADGKDEPEEPKADADDTPAVRIGTTALRQTRGRLSAKANVILLVDLPVFVGKAMTSLAESGPVGGMIPEPLKELGGDDAKPSFTGISLAAEDNAIRFKLILPMEQLQELGKASSMFMPSPEEKPAAPPTAGTAPKGDTPMPVAGTDKPDAKKEPNPNVVPLPAAGDIKPPAERPRFRRRNKDD
ncbi:MAG: hypothetical protein U0903_21685 [Planctomycetales bacterium]